MRLRRAAPAKSLGRASILRTLPAVRYNIALSRWMHQSYTSCSSCSSPDEESSCRPLMKKGLTHSAN